MRLLALALIVGQEGVPPVPPAEPSRHEITALACTFESALRGEKCVYEAVAVQVDPRDNTGRALDAGKAECAQQAAGDADLRKDCETGVGEASRSSACARTALSDATGHLAPEAADCVAARQPPPFDARAYAADQLSPGECETGARQLRQTSADQAWDALKACVERSRWPRGEFTILERLTGGFWDQDLQARPDAPRLIAKIIALRGGDVEGDIPLAQKSRVPLFTLAAALRQPDVYKGRWVLVRAAVSEMKQNAAYVRETSLRATAREVQVGPIRRTDHSSSTAVSADVQTTHYGNARGGAQINSSDRTEHSLVKQKFENERVETGRQAVGRLAQPDPFLEPDKDFIFLGRFDGVRPGEDEAPVALLSIAGYYRPNALLIQ